VLGLALVVASIALADSINPSTVVPALWLASAPRGRGLASYAVGVFAVYLAGGLVLVFGPGPDLISLLHHIRGPVEHGLQAAGGLIALGFAWALWHSRHRESTDARARRAYTPASACALGAGIMAVELPTAFMYFGAISAILASRPAAPVEVTLLTLYNALFVAPLVAIVLIRRFAGDRAERWLGAADERVRRVGRLAMPGVVSAGGAALLALGLSGLLA
jgi:hypothetical protein